MTDDKRDIMRKEHNLLPSKKDIRKLKLNQRNDISLKDREIFSDIITEKVKVLPEFQKCDDIFLYCTIKSEVQTRALINICHDMGKRVYLPRTYPDEIRFFEYKKTDCLIKSAHGIPEPFENHPADLPTGFMLMPGACFDDEGYRIGYGGGYYDRYLSSHPMIVTAVLAYEMQKSGKFAHDECDIPVDMVITEENIYRF